MGMRGARARTMSKSIAVVALVAVVAAWCSPRTPYPAAAEPTAGAGSYSVVARESESPHPPPDLFAILAEMSSNRGQVASVLRDRRNQ